MSDKSISCVDVSCWQSKINFEELKSSGITSVILRAGYGREVSQKDDMFESHYSGAKKANMKIGIYWYSYADSVEDAKREASACLTCIKGKTVDMPIYIDLEDNSQKKLGKKTITAIAKAFCEAIEKANYKAGVYANLNWFTNYLDYKELRSKYSIWLAQYNDKAELDCDIWQCTSSAKIKGFAGVLDANIIYNSGVFTPSKNDNRNKNKPTITYKVFADHKWYSEVKGLSNTAGRFRQAISGVMIKTNKGSVKYRVHLRDGNWLPWVTGYNEKDDKNGYAGILEKVIDAIQIEFEDVSDFKATYRVCGQGNNHFYDWQHNTEVDSNQEGYAGKIGKAIDRLQLTLT